VSAYYSSVRVDGNIYRQLKDLKQQSGISMVQILLVGLEKLAPMAGEAFYEGQMRGLSDAFEVSYPTCQDNIIDLAKDLSSKPDLPID